MKNILFLLLVENRLVIKRKTNKAKLSIPASNVTGALIMQSGTNGLIGSIASLALMRENPLILRDTKYS